MAEDYIMNTKINVNAREATSQLTMLKSKIVESMDKIDALQNKINSLKAETAPSKEFEELSTKLSEAQGEMDALVAKEKELSEIGATSGSVWDNTINAEADVSDRMDAIKAKMAELEATGKHIVSKDNAVEIEKTTQAIEKENAKLNATVQKYEEIKNKTDEAKNKQKGLAKESEKSFGSMGEHARKFGKTFLKLLGFASVFRLYRRLLMNIVNMTKEGLGNMAKASTEYKSKMSALSSATAELKNSLASMVAPIANAVLPLFTAIVGKITQASNALAQFFSALGGKTAYTKAKKQVVEYGKAVDDANNKLATFDDLNTLENDNGGGSGELTGADAFETAEIESNIMGFAERVKSVFDEVRSTLTGWWDGLDFEPLFIAFNKLYEAVKPLIGNIGSGLKWFWDNVLAPFGTFVIEDALPATLEAIGKAFDFIGVVIEHLKPFFLELWQNVLAPMGAYFKDTFIWIIGLIGDAFTNLSAVFRTHSGQISNVLHGLVEVFKVVWSGVKAVLEVFKSGFKTFVTYISTFVGRLIDVLDGITDFLLGVFTGDWKRALTGLKNVGRSIVNVFIDAVEMLVNTIIDVLNKMNFDIPDWVPLIGGEHVGFNIQPVHWKRLATGGITTGRTLAEIGEAGKEAVLPLEQNTEWMDMLADRIGERNISINFEGSLSQLARILKPAIDTENARIGTTLVVS